MSQLTWWAMSVLLMSAALAFLGGRLIGRVLHRILYRIALTTHTPADDRIVLRLSGPIVAICTILMWQLLTTLLLSPGSALDLAHAIGSLGLLIALAYAGMRVIDAAIEAIAVRSRWITAHRVSQSLLPLVRRMIKVVLAIIVTVMVLSELGYAVGPAIAGLGIAGIAVALAAQKTLADVFGAFAIGVDHPFHEGDVIRLDNGLSGVVEAIGLRSTRLRTEERSLVTVPNSRLAEAAIESLSARDCMRFATTLHLALDTSPAQLVEAIDELSDILSTHPRRASQEPRVHLVAIGGSSLELELVTWLSTTSHDEFLLLRERLLIRCLEVLASSGIVLHHAPGPATTAVPSARSTGLARSQGGLS
jgi:MscS family membrane protein